MEKENQDTQDKKENQEEDQDILDVKGYGYWKRENDLKDRDQFIPKKADPQTTNNEENKNPLGSAWNKAGTWEEKHYKKDSIEKYFNENIKNKKVPGLSLLSIKGYSGDAYTFFVRGKAKLVYDCNLTLEVSLENKEDDISEIEITEINNHDLDVEFDLEYKKASSEIISLVKKNKSLIENHIKVLFTEFWEAQKK